MRTKRCEKSNNDLLGNEKKLNLGVCSSISIFIARDTCGDYCIKIKKTLPARIALMSVVMLAALFALLVFLYLSKSYIPFIAVVWMPVLWVYLVCDLQRYWFKLNKHEIIIMRSLLRRKQIIDLSKASKIKIHSESNNKDKIKYSIVVCNSNGNVAHIYTANNIVETIIVKNILGYIGNS